MKTLRFQTLLSFLFMANILLVSCSSSPYKGDMYNDEPHGYGTYRYEDGAVYEGQFRYGKKFGFGTITHPDGTSEKVAHKSDVRIYRKIDIDRMLGLMRFIDKSVEKNMAIRAASERADRLAIEKDRRRRGETFDYNSFISQPVKRNTTTTNTYSITPGNSTDTSSKQKKCIADHHNFETGEYTPATCQHEGSSSAGSGKGLQQ